MRDTLVAATNYASVEEGVQAVQSALAQQDLPGARSVWQELQRQFPDSTEAYQWPASALVQQNRLDEAHALLSEGLRKFPDDVGLRTDAAWMALRRGKVDEALSRWSELLTRFPERPNNYTGYGIALRDAGRLDDAEALLSKALGQFPHDLGVAIEHAGIAHTMRDWPEAIGRWASVRERFPQFSVGYTRGAMTLREAGETAALERVLLEAMERFPDEAWPHAEHAMIAEQARNWAEALRRWDLLRQHFPGDSSGYVHAASALRELGRAQDAETMLGETIERFPDQVAPSFDHAWMAQRRRDYAEANRRWAAIRARLPNHPMGYIGGVCALRDMQDWDAAQALSATAAERFPGDIGVRLEHARLAQSRRDWAEAEQLWDQIQADFPDRAEAYIGRALVLRETGRADEAEALLDSVHGRFPQDPGMLIDRAWLAHHRKDWSASGERWANVRERLPDLLPAYTVGAAALWEQQRFDEADAVLRDAMVRFADNPEVLAAYANLATRQNNWAEALRRWTVVCDRFPGSEAYLERVHIARMRLAEVDPDAAHAMAEYVADDAIPDRIAAPGAATRREMRDVMMSFESLGGTLGGCEFGGAQRAFGAEPLGLLRWTEMTDRDLLAALDARFEGVGEPQYTELTVSNVGGRNEYRTHDKRFGMAMHTFIHEDEIPHDKMYVQACRRLQYLRRKLLEDLDAASKIFIYKTTPRILGDEELVRLHAAIRRYGDTTLLYVRTEDATHRLGDVEIIKPGLMIGYIDQFSAQAQGGRLTDSSASWAPICRNAYSLWQQQRQQSPSGTPGSGPATIPEEMGQAG